MKIKTSSIHFTADQKLLTYIDKKAGKLAQFYDRIVDASIRLKLENTGQVRDKVVEIHLNVPGETLLASETSKTFEAATDKAVETMKRQLKRYKEKLQIRRSSQV